MRYRVLNRKSGYFVWEGDNILDAAKKIADLCVHSTHWPFGGEERNVDDYEIQEVPEEKPRPVWDEITSWEKAKDFLGVGGELQTAMLEDPHNLRQLAAFDNLLTIHRAWCRKLGWKPDWHDDGQKKYYPYYHDGTVRAGESYDMKVSPFVFPDEETAERFGCAFSGMFNDLLNITGED